MKKPSLIGIECTCLLGKRYTGIANYTKNLVDHLIPDYLSNHEFEFELLYKISRIKKKENKYAPINVSTQWHYKNILPLFRNYDLVHSTDNIILNYKKPKKIVTIHDLAEIKAENQIPLYTSSNGMEKKTKWIKDIIKSTNAIIAVSECTKNDLIEHFGFPAEKIFVTYLGTDMKPALENEANNRILNSLGLLKKQYYLFVGAVSVRKNLINLIKAFHQSGEYKNRQLVIVGGQSMGYELITAEISRLGLTGQVKLPGYVPDEYLPVLYTNAEGFLFPTFYEGFGMPVIDAMCCGIPVLTSNRGASAEISGGYNLLVDPFDIDSISDGIKKIPLVSDMNTQRAKEYAETFTWEKCGIQTLDIYRSMLGA